MRRGSGTKIAKELMSDYETYEVREDNVGFHMLDKYKKRVDEAMMTLSHYMEENTLKKMSSIPNNNYEYGFYNKMKASAEKILPLLSEFSEAMRTFWLARKSSWSDFNRKTFL